MTTLRKLILGLGTAAALTAAPGALAAAITYSNFSSTAGLTLNGAAGTVGDELQLTPAVGYSGGSAFSTTQVSFDADASFSTSFDFRISSAGGLAGGADGLAFTIQTAGNNVGGIGGGLGYAGVPNSLSVEFDTFDNGEPGGSNHVAIHVAGNVGSPLATTGFLQPNFDNGGLWTAWVDYDGANDDLEVRWAANGGARPGASLLSLAGLDLVSILGQTDAFVGFSAATGAGWGDHRILAWQLNSSFDPIDDIPVPAPAVPGLLAIGLLGLLRRRSA